MSPIPIGILAASGAGAAGAMELISTQVLASDTPFITFSSIPQTYKSLQIRAVTKSTGNTTGFGLRLGAVTSGYAYHAYFNNGSSASSNSNLNGSYIMVGTHASSSTSGAFNPTIFDVIDYTSTSKTKTVRWQGGGAYINFQNQLGSGLVNSTAAISSVQLTDFALGFQTGSRFSLYGIKG
jgi:hypothetical protein